MKATKSGMKATKNGMNLQQMIGNGGLILLNLDNHPVKFNMKGNESETPTKKKLTYFNFWLMTLMAILMTLILAWPNTNDIRTSFSYRWIYNPFTGLLLSNFLFVFMVNSVSIALDKRCRWEEQFLKRLLYQLLMAWLVPLIVTVGFAGIFFYLLKIDFLSILYSKHVFPLMIILSVLVNFCYVSYYYAYFFNRAVKIMEWAESNSDHVSFRVAGKTVKVAFDDIAYLCSHGKNIALQYHSGELLIVARASLKQIWPELDPYLFFFANRFYIIARKAYQEHRKLERGLELTIIPQPHESIKISEDNRAFFLEWIDKRPASPEHRNVR